MASGGLIALQCRMHDLLALGDQRAFDQIVAVVDHQVLGLRVDQQIDEIEEIAGIERAGLRAPGAPACWRGRRS